MKHSYNYMYEREYRHIMRYIGILFLILLDNRQAMESHRWNTYVRDSQQFI